MRKSLLYGGFLGVTTASGVLLFFQIFGFSYQFFVAFLYGYAALGTFISYFTHRRLEVLREVEREAEAGLKIIWKDLKRFLGSRFSFEGRRKYVFEVNGRKYEGNLEKMRESSVLFTNVKDCKNEKTKGEVKLNLDKVERIEKNSYFQK